MTANTEIKTWQERMPAPCKQKYCTMACSPRNENNCDDCGTETIYGDQIAARDAEITELRAALEAKQQALEAAQQVAQRAGSGEAVAWLVFAEDNGVMVPQHPAYAVKLQADRYAARFGQTAVEVRPVYTAPPAAVQPDSDLQTALTVFDMGLGFALCHRDFADMRNAVKKLQEDFAAIRGMCSQQQDSGRDAALTDEQIVEAAHDAGMRLHRAETIGVEALRRFLVAIAAQQDEQAPAAKERT